MKPTAVRANKVVDVNSTIPIAVLQQTGLSTVTNSTANSSNNTSSQNNKPLISSTPSKITPLSQQQQQQQAPTSASPGQVTTTTNLVPQALNLPLAPIAFSVVAKANPGELSIYLFLFSVIHELFVICG